MIGGLYGVPIVYTEMAVQRSTLQVRRHKKVRINKKWRKRYGVKVIEKPVMYFADGGMFGKRFIAHPSFRSAIEREAKPHDKHRLSNCTE